jgi:hypothetical protein
VVCRQVAPKVLAWEWSQAKRSLPVLNVSFTGQAPRDGDAGDLMKRRRTIQDTSISSRDGGRVKRPLARDTDGRHEKIGFFRRFPTLRSPAQVAGRCAPFPKSRLCAAVTWQSTRRQAHHVRGQAPIRNQGSTGASRPNRAYPRSATSLCWPSPNDAGTRRSFAPHGTRPAVLDT